MRDNLGLRRALSALRFRSFLFGGDCARSPKRNCLTEPAKEFGAAASFQANATTSNPALPFRGGAAELRSNRPVGAPCERLIQINNRRNSKICRARARDRRRCPASPVGGTTTTKGDIPMNAGLRGATI